MLVRFVVRIATTAAMLAVWTGCAAVLGLDAGVGDEPDSGGGGETLDDAEAHGGIGGDPVGDAAHDAVPFADVGGDAGADATGASSDSGHASDGPAADVCACPPVPNGAVNCTQTGGCAHVCDQGYVDCAGSPCSCGLRCLSDQTCAACRASLQPCQLGTDCCSGNCGPTSSCL